MIAMPDPRSLTILPWRRTWRASRATCTVEGEPWPYCPRTILRRRWSAPPSAGYELKIGAELEYFLLRRGARRRARARRPARHARSALLRHARADAQPRLRLDGRRSAITGLGWDNYATDHEDANGQFEQNFPFADALTTCDRAVFFRYMVESLAQQRGLIATFMPKPFAHLTGNGCHFHISLWRDGANVFERDPAEDPRGLGLSELAYNFIGGLKAHAKAYIALTAPTVNSYKRLSVGAPTSGSTWAPAYVSYGYNNRTQMLRIPAAGRIEDRTVDGSCNPYLAATAMIAAGLDGIERGLDPGEPNAANLYTLSDDELAAAGIELLPGNLLDATRELERRTPARGVRHTGRATATTSTTTSASSGARSRPPTSRSRSGSSTATYSCSELPSAAGPRARCNVGRVDQPRPGQRRPHVQLYHREPARDR